MSYSHPFTYKSGKLRLKFFPVKYLQIALLQWHFSEVERMIYELLILIKSLLGKQIKDGELLLINDSATVLWFYKNNKKSDKGISNLKT